MLLAREFSSEEVVEQRADSGDGGELADGVPGGTVKITGWPRG